ncbi:Hypothetical_protein [Hexamita inflata]|uniref:Hypothetical_protein n=1 Tax=Hexamita inflata TaxID=28002 RepID=A0AA86ULF2_9EUKA|nr:Hypothetical protein HINF_LOCUS43517 [Hexamita inflata]
MSKECNDTDQDALSMRVNEVLMQFTANPNQAGNLISKFLAHFQMSQFKGKKGIQTDYQFKLATEAQIDFLMQRGQSGKAMQAVERYENDEKVNNISEEIVKQQTEKNFPQNVVQIPAKDPPGNGTVIKGQTSILTRKELQNAIDHMPQYDTCGASGIESGTSQICLQIQQQIYRFSSQRIKLVACCKNNYATTQFVQRQINDY